MSPSMMYFHGKDRSCGWCVDIVNDDGDRMVRMKKWMSVAIAIVVSSSS